METSAKTGHNVEEVNDDALILSKAFMALTKQIYTKHKLITLAEVPKPPSELLVLKNIGMVPKTRRRFNFLNLFQPNDMEVQSTVTKQLLQLPAPQPNVAKQDINKQNPQKQEIEQLKSSLNSITTWRHIRLFLVGDSGAGKTSLVRWLKGEPFNPAHVSTDSVEVSTAEVNSWKEMEFDIKDYMADVVKTKPISTGLTSTTTTTINSSPKVNQVKNFNNIIQQKSTDEYVMPPPLAKEIRERMDKVSQVNQAFHVWDFAGQEEYYNTHHFFLSETAIYLLVVDISKPKNISRAKFWLDSIKCYVVAPTVVLVGTHSDESTDLDAVTNLAAELNDPCITQSFSVSCKNDSPTNIRLALASLAQLEVLKTTCKLSWLLFFDAISKVEKDSSVTYLSWIQATQISASFKMDEDDTKEALKFFHQNGYVLYFDEPALNHILFTKPQQLIDVFKTVITALGLKNIIQPTELQLLQEQGRMKPHTLRKLWQEFDAELFRLFTVLFQKFGLGFIDPEQIGQGLEADLIIPCMVQPLGDHLKKRFEGSPLHVACLIETVPPLGFANRLISTIMSFTNIGGVSYCEIFQGGCTFTQSEIMILVTISPGQVVVQATAKKPVSIGDTVPLIGQLLDNIYSTAKAHKKAAQITTITNCFMCGQPKVIADFQQERINHKLFGEGSFLCPKCRGQYSRQEIQHATWLTKNSKETTSLIDHNILTRPFCEVVTKEEHWNTLCLILDTAKTGGWRDVGAELGKSVMQLDGIEKDAIYEKMKPAKILLREWQHGEGATMGALLNVLKHVNNNTALEYLSAILATNK